MSVLEAVIPWATGPISVISSITIIIMILRSKKALSIPYHRILFGLSIVNIIASVALSAGSLPAPKDAMFLKYNFGNRSTCDTQGSLFLVGATAEPLYQCSLQLYYLCKIKYEMKAVDIQRKLEPFLHFIPILIGITVAIVSLVTESINATSSWCYIESYPHGCRDNTDTVCTRGKGILWKRIVAGAIPFFLSFIFMVIATSMIYRAVQKKEVASDRFKFRPSAPSLQTNEVKPRQSLIQSVRTSITELFKKLYQENTQESRKMLNRIVQYFAAYLLANFFPLLAIFTSTVSERNDTLFIFQNIFYPLQGFYTLLVFINPHYKRVSNLHEELSILKVFAVTILSYGGAEYRLNLCIRDEEDIVYEENEPDPFEYIDMVIDQMERRNSVISPMSAQDIIEIDEEVPMDASKTNRIEEEFGSISSNEQDIIDEKDQLDASITNRIEEEFRSISSD